MVDEGPAPSDVILVLAGDYTCGRILKGAELAAQGYAPKVMVSSPVLVYGRPEGELAIECAVARGASRSLFELMPYEANSTTEEALALRETLKRKAVRRLLIVTSSSHTRRAGVTFREVLGPGISVRTVASPDPFDPDSWWTTRRARKTFLLEWTKTVAQFLGI